MYERGALAFPPHCLAAPADYRALLIFTCSKARRSMDHDSPSRFICEIESFRGQKDMATYVINVSSFDYEVRFL